MRARWKSAHGDLGFGDGGALGPDQGTPRIIVDSATHEHEEHGGGAHEHSPHMPGTAHELEALRVANAKR